MNTDTDKNTLDAEAFEELLRLSLCDVNRAQGEALLRELETLGAEDDPSPELDTQIARMTGGAVIARQCSVKRTSPPKPGAHNPAGHVVTFPSAAKRRGMRPLKRLALVACAVFAVSVTAMLYSAGLRTALFEWAATLTGFGYDIGLRETDKQDIPYDLSALPDNFDYIYVPGRLPARLDSHEMNFYDFFVVLKYSGDNGNMIRIEQSYLKAPVHHVLSGDHESFEPITVGGGYEGYKMADSEGYLLFWSNGDYYFTLHHEGDLPLEALTAVADSMEKTKKIKNSEKSL